MMEQIQNLPAATRDPAAAPAPVGYVRIGSLVELRHQSAYSVGAVVFKKDGPGRTPIYTSPFAAWTPVTDQLPDDETLVLIALNDDDVWTGYRDAGAWRYPDETLIAHERVTHWMPLPALPGVAA